MLGFLPGRVSTAHRCWFEFSQFICISPAPRWSLVFIAHLGVCIGRFVIFIFVQKCKEVSTTKRYLMNNPSVCKLAAACVADFVLGKKFYLLSSTGFVVLSSLSSETFLLLNPHLDSSRDLKCQSK